MTALQLTKFSMAVVAAALTCGCANGGLDLSTGSLGSQPVVAKADPICTSLSSQISALKADPTIGKLEQAADGKGSNVSVKRTALQKQAELNKAYGQYQARCSSSTATAAIPAPQATAAAN
jgi:hypothetical protein